MKKINKICLLTSLLYISLIANYASASIIEFHFTGQYTLVDTFGSNMDRQAIDSTLTFDSNLGTGFAADMTIANFDTFGATATIYDISLEHVTGTELIVGNMLADWNGNIGVPLSMVWDATGLFNAIDYGLQAGDVISGTNLKRGGFTIADVGSAIPASDDGFLYNQGPAPMAVTTWNTSTLCNPFVDCMGNAVSGGWPLIDDGIAGSPMIDGPFPGLSVNFDIGSGNSLTVLSVSAVPVPAAVWLFGSGLLALIGIARKKSAL